MHFLRLKSSATRQDRVERSDKGSQNREGDRDGKERIVRRRKIGHLRRTCLLPRPRNRAEDTTGGSRREKPRENGREHGTLHRLPHVEKNGHEKQDVHSRIQRRIRNFFEGRKRPRRAQDPLRRQKNKGEKDGNEHRIEAGDPLRPFMKNDGRDKQPRKGKAGRKSGTKGVEPRKHSRARNEGTEDKEPICRLGKFSEESRKALFRTAVLFPEHEEEGAHRREERTGKKYGKKCARREKADELGARHKTRADRPSHDEKRPRQGTHPLFLCRNRKENAKIYKNYVRHSTLSIDKKQKM